MQTNHIPWLTFAKCYSLAQVLPVTSFDFHLSHAASFFHSLTLSFISFFKSIFIFILFLFSFPNLLTLSSTLFTSSLFYFVLFFFSFLHFLSLSFISFSYSSLLLHLLSYFIYLAIYVRISPYFFFLPFCNPVCLSIFRFILFFFFFFSLSLSLSLSLDLYWE